MMKFVYDIAFVQFDISIIKYPGSRRRDKSKYLSHPVASSPSFLVSDLRHVDIGLNELAIERKDKCEENSFGWSEERLPIIQN